MSPSPAHRLALALAAASLVACSSEPSPRPEDPPRVVARFDPGAGELPNFLDIPFPSDVYLEADGTIVDTIPGFDAYVTLNAASLQATLANLRGFGRNTGAVFRIDAADASEAAPEIDAGSLPADEAASIADEASIFLLDLDADAASARVPCRVAFHDDRGNGSDRPPVLAVLPARGVVLGEGRRYAAVLTSKVTSGGDALGPSEAFRAIRDGEDRGGALGKLYGDAVDRAGELVPALADRKRIAAIAVFTTQATADELVAMRAIAAKLPPPALSWDPADIAPMHAAFFTASPVPGATATLDAWLGAPAKLPGGADDPARDQSTGAAHDAIAAIGTAVFEAPNFLQERSSYLDPEHATVARDGDGLPALDPAKPTAKIWVSIALPKSAPPPGGFPVIILQHGLQGDRSFLLALANTFAREGWATAAIEATTFGARSSNPANVADKRSNFPWSEAAAYGGPDGFVDSAASALAFFGEFYNFGATRDQLRQSVVDLGTLADVLADPALDLGPLAAAVPGAKLDGGRIGYVGDSFGSIVGSMVAAVDPRIRAFVLNVGGGGIATEIVSNAPAIASLVSIAGGLNFGFSRDRFDASHPMINVFQAMLDAADPLSHARRIALEPASLGGAQNPPKSVILIEALWDELVANEGSEALARAAGMPLAVPNVGPNGGVPLPEAAPVGGVIRGVPVSDATAVLVQASPASHGSDLYNARGKRHYAIPFARPGATPFPVLPKDIPVRQPYLGLQAMAVAFFESHFAGEVPVVTGIPVPVRDFDDDGVDDAADPDPADPSKK